MNFCTVINARVPRANCKACGVKTMVVPWADRFSSLTKLMENHVIEVLLAASSISAGCRLLQLDWDTANRIMARAVERGMDRRDQEEPITYAGIDEKSFKKGQSYISVLNDLGINELGAARVIDVVEDRTNESTEKLWDCLSETQRTSVRAVAMDLWNPFRTVTERKVPNADIVHDRYHLSAYLSEAINKVRRAEHRKLRQEGDDRLKGTRFLLVTHPDKLDEDRALQLQSLSQANLQTSRAWAIKESFREFWSQPGPFTGEVFFKTWYAWAIRSRLEPIKKVARMFKRHVDRILNYFAHPITNAVAEGLNSKIQSIKNAARGFRGFKNYRIRILFYCGRLDMTHTLGSIQ